MTRGKGLIAIVFRLLIVCMLGSCFFADSCIATGTTIYVDDSNTAGPWDGTENYPYRTIQEGITAASAGDTVNVSSGTYNENLVVTKDLSLQGENKDTTFVDGGGNGHVIRANGTAVPERHIEVHISGFTIRNAGGDGFDCIAYYYIANGEITNNKIINSQLGKGISLTNCHAITVNNNLIMNNKMSGISLIVSNENIIESNIIQNNQKGIYIASYSTNNQIISNTIRDNSQYGVHVLQSSGNFFSLNDFNGDGDAGNDINAFDSSTNSWSVNNQGNYWRDYNKYDNNSDGIGDTAYSIPGGNNIDAYSLGYFLVPEQPGDENEPPTAVSLSISETSALEGATISFYGEGIDDGHIVGYYWRSNLNGFLNNQQSFSTTTLSVGTHTIYFKVLDNQSEWSTEITGSITINSSLNHAPTAFIDEITPNPVQQGELIMFRGHGTDQDGPITAYKWFSTKDGGLSTSSSFSRSNFSLGTHTIYFQVKDSTDWSPQVTLTLVIQTNSSYNGSSENHVPTADVGGPYQGKVNEVIIFNGTASHDDDGQIISYSWSFGDQNSGTGPVSTHAYAAPGAYTVTLQVTDDKGATTTAFTSVTISQSSSQGNSPGAFSGISLEHSFPILIVIVFLVILGVIGGFIIHMRRR